MIGIRKKIMLGFGGLLAVVAAIGIMTMAQINDLGRAIDVILRENYRSVIACQEMKESIERIDSGVLFFFLGSETEGRFYVDAYTTRFLKALDIELGNITVPGEKEKANEIQALFQVYRDTIPLVTDTRLPLELRRTNYFKQFLPLFKKIKGISQEILEMNQKNMSDANNTARKQAASAHRKMLTVILVSACIALLFSLLIHRWILKPLHKLIDSTNEIRQGNLDLVLKSESNDEIGRLSDAFNAMTASLREVRRNEHLDLVRSRKATEEVFKALPEAIAVFNLDGCIDFSTETADKHFGLKPGACARDLGYNWLITLLQHASQNGYVVEWTENKGFIQLFIENREYFFQPVAIPIYSEHEPREYTGTTIILRDVTQVFEQKELKQGVVSTVSHQLRTPLTSLRMSVHLLLEGRVGPINEKQTELLLAARDDSERLSGILDDLIDINRMETGKTNLDLLPVSPQQLVNDGIEPFLTEAKDKGISLMNHVPDDIPPVKADPVRIRHVFSNLVSNALRYTNPGGSIDIKAQVELNTVRFTVEDTGPGIPQQHLKHLFDQFYRVPSNEYQPGAGLGLAIVKEIVRAHSGEVGVESTPGTGSQFWFTLPLYHDNNTSGVSL